MGSGGISSLLATPVLISGSTIRDNHVTNVIAVGGAGSSGLPALRIGTTVRINATAKKTRRLGRNEGVANAW